MRRSVWHWCKTGPSVASFAAAIFIAAWATTAQAQTRVTGRVVDAADRSSIPSAQVLVTGTTVGATTNDSGRFTLTIPAAAKTLTVRRIGFLSRAVPVSQGQTDYTITLDHDVLRLEAEVVTGVATTVSAKSAANDVAVVTATQVSDVPAPTIENAIQGQIPGALIQYDNGGAPGGGMQVQIRGITSLNAAASPLYVIDGVIVDNDIEEPGDNAITFSTAGGVAPASSDLGVNRIADFNPDDIESIEVLKGASASAIYGSKASAGVIIITTKKGKSGKPAWNFSNKVGAFSDSKEMPIRNFPTLSSAQAWYNNDIKGGPSGAALAADNAYISSIYNGPQNYQSQLFGNTGASYETDLSVSGTQAGTQFFLSGLSKYDNGILLNTGYSKQSIRSNVTQQFSSALSATANLFYSNAMTRRGITGNDNNGISPYDVFSYTPQFMNLDRQNPDGSWAHNYFGVANPFGDAYDITTPEAAQRFVGGGNINWKVFSTESQSLQFNAIGGVDIAHVRDGLYAPSSLQIEGGQALPGVSTTQTDDNQYINYSLNLIHHYTGIAGVDATTSAGFVRERRDRTTPEVVSQNLLAGVNNPSTGTVQTTFYTQSAQRDQSLYAQEQVLTLHERLSLTAGVTAERTTNDGDIGKYYAYPRYSAAYRIPQFVGFLDELKVRGAIGSSGTQPNYGVRYTPLGTALIGGLPGVVGATRYGNANVKPESEVEMETGFDATFFRSRAQLSFTVYQKRISSLLLQADLSPSRGYSQAWLNGGEFTNQGAEISLSATPVQLRNGFTWTTTTSFFRNYSVVNALPVPPFSGFNTYIAVGRSVSDIINSNVTDPNGMYHQQGDALPTFTVQGTEALSYGPFRLSATVQWDKGGQLLAQNMLYFAFGSLYGDSAYSASWASRWNANANPWTESAAFVKLRTVSISYTLPARWLQVAGGRITSARLSLDGRNLLQWYACTPSKSFSEACYDGLDPETNSGGNEDLRLNNEVTPYPPARSFFLSLDLGL